MRKACLSSFGLALGLSVVCLAAKAPADAQVTIQKLAEPTGRPVDWPILKRYDEQHLAKIALPLGGIGTGTVSLGGRGDLRDWEIMNRPAKGFTPKGTFGPFFAVFVKDLKGQTQARGLEGPIDLSLYEDASGSSATNHGLPRFRKCTFAAAYPLGQVILSDLDMPVDVTLQAFNPLVPCDPETSGIPVAVLRYVVRNKTNQPLEVSVCGNVPNFIGNDSSGQTKDHKGDLIAAGGKANRNEYRPGKAVNGIFMSSEGVAPRAPQWGTIALTTTATTGITHRVSWLPGGWGSSGLDFWDDFSADGKLDKREPAKKDDAPMGSLAVTIEVPPKRSVPVTFLVTWHFPNRITWTPKNNDQDRIGNYYTTVYKDAWDVAERVAPQIDDLEKKTVGFVGAFCSGNLPEVVKEAALFNISTLRTQTCFRTEDGRFYGFEGCSNKGGCCHGSCTHVWNYEQATAFLFGGLAKMMREIEFAQATDDQGIMSFRVNLPLERSHEFHKAAADGQMGCIMKMYRDWQLSGDDAMLKTLWPKVKKAVEFCWIPGGWDADKDGVMEGCQHNTMDVEYYGPNPQMGIWYLGALRAAEEMARRVGDNEFAAMCKDLFERGSKWVDANLFNGQYYVHQVRPPKDQSQIAASLLVGMGAKDPANPDYQLGSGCLVDQLVGQFMAHVCGLGYLVDQGHVRTTLGSIMKYNYRDNLYGHFNCMRSFGLGDEAVLLMADYPKDRPNNPFPYFSEVMTGFEYTAAVGMLYEGQTGPGLKCIKNVRNRYDGQKRSPFDEAECGHHYARAMASWAAVLALTGFQYSGVDKTMTFAPKEGRYFWSNGYAWGTCTMKKAGRGMNVELTVLQGQVTLSKFALQGLGSTSFKEPLAIPTGSKAQFSVARAPAGGV